MSLRLRLPSATIAVATLAFSEALTAMPPLADNIKQQRAQATYEQGVEAYRHGRFRAAIDHFLAADELAPSPALAFNAARAYEKLGEEARALQHYRDYLRRGADPSNAREVERRVKQLEAELAKQGVQQLTVLSEPTGASLRIGGTERGITPWTGELPLGPHELTATLDGHVSKRVRVDVHAAAARDLVIELPRQTKVNRRSTGASSASSVADDATAPGSGAVQTGSSSDGRTEARASWPKWPWVTVGAGGLTLAGAGLFELLRRDAESDAKHARYQPAYHEHRDRMERHQTTARVLTGVGTTLVVGGGILFLVDAVTDERLELPPVALTCDTATCLGIWNGSF